MPRERRIAVICTRRLGDVLLATAMIRSLKRAAQPGTRIEALVSPETVPALIGNPDVDEIIAVPHRPTWREAWALLKRIFRRYEVAVTTIFSDRAHILAFLASARRVAVVPPANEPGAGWKRWLAWKSLRANDRAMNVVEQNLQLIERMHVMRWPEVVPPRPVDLSPLDRKLGEGWRDRRYAVVHPAAMYPYKGWTLEGWRALVADLAARDLHVYLTGGPAEAERALAASIVEGMDAAHVTNLAGELKFPELTPLIERARVFVGPDTSVTHLAAATGAPTIALFGPSNVVAWGPWPRSASGRSPAKWKMSAPLQHQGNVWIIQGVTHCAPCLLEGCERHQQSRSDCLAQMPSQRVLAVIDEALRAA
ncbi:MAG TPA: glycosyltransferase family 9 protein [Nevskiaceae bacterium]|nr:glycosyltransferase family 9 protein [Nevskiaceae bacterium]